MLVESRVKKEKINKIFNILKNSPINFASENSNFEISGNKEVKIEGCKKILEFSQECIKISVKGMHVIFSGRNLTINCLTSDSLLVKGFIKNIEFNT